MRYITPRRPLPLQLAPARAAAPPRHPEHPGQQQAGGKEWAEWTEEYRRSVGKTGKNGARIGEEGKYETAHTCSAVTTIPEHLR